MKEKYREVAIEEVPVEDGWVDVVISKGVIGGSIHPTNNSFFKDLRENGRPSLLSK